MKSGVAKAMILAAGYGTRLKPLTDALPKALIEYNGKPMIENVIMKLKNAGINEITVNAHHFAGKIKEYFDNNKFGLKINLSIEKEILGTGGGIKNAREFLKGSGNFIVHNVDVESAIDLNEIIQFHFTNNSLAALAVKKRNTSRPLLTDENNNLVGRIRHGKEQLFTAGSPVIKTAFSGVYVLSDRVFDLFPDKENFDIVLFLLEAVKRGEKIVTFDIGDTSWKDLGSYEDFVKQ